MGTRRFYCFFDGGLGNTQEERHLQDTGLGLYYTDFLPDTFKEQCKLIFTFRYEDGRWEGTDFEINISPHSRLGYAQGGRGDDLQPMSPDGEEVS